MYVYVIPAVRNSFTPKMRGGMTVATVAIICRMRCVKKHIYICIYIYIYIISTSHNHTDGKKQFHAEDEGGNDGGDCGQDLQDDPYISLYMISISLQMFPSKYIS